LTPRLRGRWPPADLLLIRWPHHTFPPDAEPDLDDQLARLLGDCRALLDRNGHLLTVIGLDRAEPTAVTRAVIDAAPRTGLRLTQRHVAVPGSGTATDSGTTAPPPQPRRRQIDLLVFTHAGRDD